MNGFTHAFDPLGGPGPQRRRRNPFWRIRRFLFVIALLAVAGVGAVLFAFSQTELPEDRFGELALTSYLCTAEVTENCGAENAAAQLSTPAEDRELVTYDELPQHLIDAVVATEDQDFFGHQGVDPRGIARASYQFLRQQGVTQGGSTITQQYVKLAFNDQDRTLERKAREALRAIKLEQELAQECEDRPDLGDKTPKQCAKEEILTRYLNRAYFGRGAAGVRSAARAYFDKDVDVLTVSEAAFLAGLLRNPSAAEPENDPDEALRRRLTSLENMVKFGFLTLEDAQLANETPLATVPKRDLEGLGEVLGAEWGTEYFVEEVRQQLDVLFPGGEIRRGGYRVYTTLDRDLQRSAYLAAYDTGRVETFEELGVPLPGPAHLDPGGLGDPSAALVSVDGDGRVVAMLAGRDFEANEFNLVTSKGGIGRQPGSTFKPIGMATALSLGMSPESLIPAEPGVLEISENPCGSPAEPWRVSGGSSGQDRYRTLINALTYSSNVVFAELMMSMPTPPEQAPDQLAARAQSLGITVDLSVDGRVPCSLILGSREVPPIDMATVYSTFERAGQRVDPVLIEKIENVDGEVICWYPVNGRCKDSAAEHTGEEVIDPHVARMVNYAMTQVVSVGTGKRAVLSEDWPVAGKTGTSQNNVDGWFAGFTCDLTTVVWVGHDGDTQVPMIDFRKPPPEDGSPVPLNEDGIPVDDRNWPNVEGGNLPTFIWQRFMSDAVLDRGGTCEGLEITTDFTGEIYNNELSISTLPPCGVELDQFGYPRGSSPDDFAYVTTTTVPPTSQPPPAQPGDTQPPQGLTRQPEQPQPTAGEATPTTAPCVDPAIWEYQRDPGGPPPTDPNATTTLDPNDPNAPSTSVDPNATTSSSVDPSTTGTAPTTGSTTTTTSATSTTISDQTTTEATTTSVAADQDGSDAQG